MNNVFSKSLFLGVKYACIVQRTLKISRNNSLSNFEIQDDLMENFKYIFSLPRFSQAYTEIDWQIFQELPRISCLYSYYGDLKKEFIETDFATSDKFRGFLVQFSWISEKLFNMSCQTRIEKNGNNQV